MSRRRQQREHKVTAEALEPATAAKTQLWQIVYTRDGLLRDGPITAGKLVIGEEFPTDAVTWLHVSGLGGAASLAAVARHFTIHDLAMEAIVAPQERPKVDVYGETLFAVLRTPMSERSDSGLVTEVGQFSFVLGERFLVTFEDQPLPRLEGLRNRLRGNHGRIRQSGPDFLAQQIIDGVVDQAADVTYLFEEELEAIEDRIIEGRIQGVTASLLALRRDLLRVRRAVQPMCDAVRAMLSDAQPLIRPETVPHFRDVLDHMIQSVERIDSFRDLEQGLINLVISTQGARLGETMKVLTVASVIFMPLTLIAGIYGMNFDTASPWNMPELTWAFGYPFAIGLMVVVTLVMLHHFRRRGWLHRDRELNRPLDLDRPLDGAPK
jgi:magnesium transporter